MGEKYCTTRLTCAKLVGFEATFGKRKSALGKNGQKKSFLLRFVIVYMLGLRPFRLRIRIEVKLTTKKTVNATVKPIKSEKSFSTIS